MRLAVASPNQRRTAFRVGWLFLAVLAFALQDVQGAPPQSRPIGSAKGEGHLRGTTSISKSFGHSLPVTNRRFLAAS